MVDLDVRFVSNLLCKLADFSVYFTTSSAHYLLAVITVDRFVSIVFPNRFAIFQRRSFHILQACVVCGYAFLSNLPTILFNELIVTGYHDNQTNKTVETRDCVLVNNANVFIYWLGVINPVWVNLLNIVLSTLTIASIFKSRSKLKSNRNSSKDRMFAIAIIAQNVSCVLCKTPLVVFMLINSYLGLDYERFEMFLTISITIFLIENANVSLVNYVFNSIFKREVLLLLRIFSANGKSDTTRSMGSSVTNK